MRMINEAWYTEKEVQLFSAKEIAAKVSCLPSKNVDFNEICVRTNMRGPRQFSFEQVIAMRNISAGAELFINYGKAYGFSKRPLYVVFFFAFPLYYTLNEYLPTCVYYAFIFMTTLTSFPLPNY